MLTDSLGEHVDDEGASTWVLMECNQTFLISHLGWWISRFYVGIPLPLVIGLSDHNLNSMGCSIDQQKPINVMPFFKFDINWVSWMTGQYII